MKIAIAALAAASVFAGAAWSVEACRGDAACGARLSFLRDPALSDMRFAKDEQGGGAESPRRRKPSLRDADEAIFVRGGHTFAAGGSGGLADGKGAQLYSVGYRTRIREGLPLSFEAEVVYQKDSDPVIIGLGQETATRRAISGLASLRWDGPKFGPIRPYVSGGFGPVQVRTEIDDGVAPLADANIELGYGARVGVSAPLFRNVSIEAGYRLLGATNDDIKTHSAEIGLSYHF